MLSITLGASLAKSLFPLIGAAGATALRLGLAALILCIVQRVWRVRLNRRMLWAVLPYGISLGVMNLLFYMAIQRIPLGIAIALEFTGPLTVAILSSRRLADLGWAALAVVGLLLLLSLNMSAGSMDLVGMGFALAAGVFWGLYILTGKRAGDALGAQTPALGIVIAAAIAMPFGLMEAGTALLDTRVLGLGLAVALLSSAIPYSLEMFALRRLPVKTFGILTSGEPAVGAVIGMIFLGETLSPMKWLGIAAIIAASAGTTLSASRKDRVPQ
ncbi:inner membrane transporter RhtA [Luteibacter sp. Sphag1AF]|uniref:EamA family transporter n=1 Tax=Luteibacter sp. Sphag1AF TaxID=2587031 RepID=UPI001614F015|nr:EamA family transporter [Luteibacter sp. Sphag1AF]MBB3227840.1 inner membrane transporter RhtA [Luteibacter sp. Sphag1AF]